MKSYEVSSSAAVPTVPSDVSSRPSHRFRALSVRQPWAYLIMSGQKTLELRRWNTPYRGLLLLHASQVQDELALQSFGLTGSGLATGCLLGAVDLIDVARLTPEALVSSYWQHRDFAGYERSINGLVVQALHVFPEPIPMAGNRGIFVIVDDAIERSIMQQLPVSLWAEKGVEQL